MNTFNRAEAICALNNILALSNALKETLGSQFPSGYYDNIVSRANSMRTTIINNKRYKYITDKMNAWIKNTWWGLRRWDHEHMYNADILHDVGSVMLWLHKKDEEKNVSANNTDNCAICSSATIPNRHDKCDDRNNNGGKNAKQEMTVCSVDECINAIMAQVTAEKMKLIDANSIRHGDIKCIMSLTRSIRTQELIKAAYYMGVVNGMKKRGDHA